MFWYYLNIAGLSIAIESPVSIMFQNCLMPFRKRNGIKPDLLYRVVSGQVKYSDTVVSRGEYSVGKNGNRYVRMKNLFHDGQSKETFLCAENPGIYNLYIPREWLDEESVFRHENILDFLALEEGLLLNQAFLLHASFVSWNGTGILFTAPSGTGKSTQADLWHQYEKAEIYNGDRTIIRKIDGAYYGFGSPYAGSSGIYRNEKAPVAGIVVLTQASDNHIERLNGKEAFTSLYRETLMNTWNHVYMETMTDLILDAVENIPIYHLACRPDKEAVDLVKGTLQI